MPLYRNKSNQTLTIPNVGIVDPGETIESATIIENPSFEEVKSDPSAVNQEGEK